MIYKNIKGIMGGGKGGSDIFGFGKFNQIL
jgi:hypothetical protein